MAVGSMTAIQLGSGLAVLVFKDLTALGTAGVRLAAAGLFLLVLIRPRPSDLTRQDVLACVTLGAATAGMMLFFLLAADRLPLGTASALQFLGPLGVALTGRGNRRRVWTLSAAIGVLLLTEPWHGTADAIGVVFALVAAASWAAYILQTQRVGDRVTGLNGLAISMTGAGVIGLLAAAPSLWLRTDWGPVLITGGLALLSPVLPFALEFLALRRLTSDAFGTLMSLEPAIALAIGMMVLEQAPSLTAVLGIVCVAIAGAGATRTGNRAVELSKHSHEDQRWAPDEVRL